MNLAWETFTIQAKHPFKISRSVQESVERVWVRVTEDGQEGWGEADPSPYYGETAATVGYALERLRPVIESTSVPDFDGLETLERELRAALDQDGSARAAVSAALHDLAGKREGQPLWKLWGLDPAGAPPSSFTIGLDEPAVVRKKVEEAAEYPILKVKLGTDRDEELLSTIADAATPGTVLRVDANGAWTASEAISGWSSSNSHFTRRISTGIGSCTGARPCRSSRTNPALTARMSRDLWAWWTESTSNWPSAADRVRLFA
jgi:L-alanine-DL-glutamate epimerase-like enolase superfamily enzyme